MPLPIAFYFQTARALEPTQAALMLVPMAVVSGVMAPFVGRLTDRTEPRWIAFAGFLIVAASLAWMSLLMTADRPFWQLLIPPAFLGLGLSGLWAPLATSATRNLPPALAGAGSGVYNMTRQVGSVLGSAAIAALISSRLAAELPGMPAEAAEQSNGELPAAVAEGFSTAMGQSLLLPIAAFLVGSVVVLFFEKPRVQSRAQSDKSA